MTERNAASKITPSSHNVEVHTPQGLSKHGGDFRLLDQNGPFQMPEAPLTSLGETRDWLQGLTPGDRMLFETSMNNIRRLTGFNSIREIKEQLSDPATRAEVILRSNRIFAENYGLTGTDSEISSKIENYAETAIRYRTKVAKTLRREHAYANANELADIKTIRPIRLVELMFLGSSRKLRHQSAMILDGIMKAAEADQQTRENEDIISIIDMMRGRRIEVNEEGTERSFESHPVFVSNIEDFQSFLNRFVHHSDTPPESYAILQSTHNLEDYSVRSIRRMSEEEARFSRDKKQPKNKQLTTIVERSFKYKGRTIPVYIETRDVKPEDIVEKKDRKGNAIPGQVTDKKGMLIVVENTEDMIAFHKALLAGANEAGLKFKIHESDDSLSNSTYDAHKPGSSEHLRTFKYVATVGSLIIEIQYYDHVGFVESLYRNGVSHKEYQINRIIKSGIAEHQYPVSIYELKEEDPETYYERLRVSLIERTRRDVRNGVFSS